MMLVLDTMAQKYGMLPYQVLEQASTGDLQIHIAVERYRQIKNNPDMDLNKAYSQEELQEVWQRSQSQ
jgi:hypothetical protein